MCELRAAARKLVDASAKHWHYGERVRCIRSGRDARLHLVQCDVAEEAAADGGGLAIFDRAGEHDAGVGLG
jgi:hypothetical protein